MNPVTPWTPIALLVLTAVLTYLWRGRLLSPWPVGLTGTGLAAVSLVLLRLSPDTAPVGFPWPPALDTAPRWAADSEMFTFALVLLVLLAGAILAERRSAAQWPSAFLLAAGAILFMLSENLLALALSWLLLEAVALLARGHAQDGLRLGADRLDILWGFLGLAGILYAWHATQGGSLRPYETGQWTAHARTVLLAVVVIRLGAYPLVSRGLPLGGAGFTMADVSALAPVVAGLALGQRVASLGTLSHPSVLAWLGAASSLVCGFVAWHSASPRDRLHWALRTALGLVLMMWGTGAIDPMLLFPAAALSFGLGFGLWMLRPPLPASVGLNWQRVLLMAAWSIPPLVLALGPLAPSTHTTLRLWQSLLDGSAFVPLAIGLAGQAMAIAALTRPASEKMRGRDATGWAVFGCWLLAALTVTMWPGATLVLAGADPSKTAATIASPPTLGAWAALVLPLLGALALPQPARPGDVWQARIGKAARFLSLLWIRRPALAAARWSAQALRDVEDLLSGEAYLPWAMAFLLGIVLLLEVR